jgi:hypothetical protein
MERDESEQNLLLHWRQRGSESISHRYAECTDGLMIIAYAGAISDKYRSGGV